MTKLEYYYQTIISNYIQNKHDFINLMCVNSKNKKLNKWYKTINSPFKDDKLFPNNPGPVANKWEILYIKNNNKIKTSVNYNTDLSKYKACYLHSIEDPLAVSSRYKELPKIIIPQNKILSDMFSFNFLFKLTKIVLPTTITRLDNKFQHCDRLKKIIIPTSVKHINGCFFKCGSLESIIIPTSVTYINRSFNFNDNLKSLTLHPNIQYINDSVRYNHNLTEINGIPAYKNITDSFANNGNLL